MTLPEAVVAIDIAASPQRVWEVITDITVMPRFSSELQAVEWADGFTAAARGAVFLGRNRHPAVGEWTTRSEIVEFEPGHVFAWAVGDPANPAATWRFDLSPGADGTRLSYSGRIGPGRSGVTMMIERDPGHAAEIIANRLDDFRSGMTATLEGIREIAQADDRG